MSAPKSGDIIKFVDSGNVRIYIEPKRGAPFFLTAIDNNYQLDFSGVWYTLASFRIVGNIHGILQEVKNET